MTVRLAISRSHPAAAVGQDAWHVLELDGRVMNAEPAQNFIDAFEDGLACRWRHVFDQNMRTERVRFCAETPDMQVVNVEDTFDIGHRARDMR